ncbi:MAG: GAF domain-containing protein [Rubrivivax sp.]|nr:GAF domain-containing protein [Rubrivivax sp.]
MDSPAFGQADLSNCERELIHLAGSVQPQGALLLLHPDEHSVQMASANCAEVLGAAVESLLGQPLACLGGNLAEAVAPLLPGLGEEPLPLRCHVGAGATLRRLEGSVHCPPGGGVVVELEPVDRGSGASAVDLNSASEAPGIAIAVQRFSAATSLPALCDAIVQVLRDMTGYDRVMVYRFDPDGHGKIVAESRDPRLESLLGHHYPATDIPQRARELYLRNRVRVLADVHYEAQPLVPPLRPDSGAPLDMSMCHLRSMSPLHLQYLKNMGVTGTLVASLVREGRLWGLIAAHHYSPRHLRLAVRAVVDLLAEVASTRIAAIENYAHTQVALMVRRLEQRLIEATSTEGDWRHALFRNPHTLLQPLGATGAALFHGDEILTTGEVPSTPELRALLAWVHAQPRGAENGAPVAHASVGKAHPPLAALAPTAAGVLAVQLSASRPDYLMWLRKEQLLTVTWAGDPHKPMEDDDPLKLSPRRSFAAWSEIVRGTALPWSTSEEVMAGAIGTALVDIIVQVHAVRLLIAEHQLTEVRATVGAAREPVLLADARGGLLFANQAFLALRGAGAPAPVPGEPVALLFDDTAQAQRVVSGLAQHAWRGELTVAQPGAAPTAGGGTPVKVRAEAVPGRDGRLLGSILSMTDLRGLRRTVRARRQLEEALQRAGSGHASGRSTDEVVGAILTNASLAAMDIADASHGASVASLLQELEASAERATALYARIRQFSGNG